MTRESASRPRSSVPSQWPGSAPGCQKGGVAPRMMSCSSGSFGAIHGAPSASTIRNKMKQPPTIAFGSRKQARIASNPREDTGPTAGAAASAMTQSRIGGDDEQVDDHIDEDEQDAKDERQALDQWQVAIDDGVDRH